MSSGPLICISTGEVTLCGFGDGDDLPPSHLWSDRQIEKAVGVMCPVCQRERLKRT